MFMDFDAFVDEATRKVKKKKLAVKSISTKKRGELLENIVIDDECTGVPQTEAGGKVYK